MIYKKNSKQFSRSFPLTAGLAFEATERFKLLLFISFFYAILFFRNFGTLGCLYGSLH
jgi:hypothetical protein|tara:strand:+ start:1857 stop:2030 length:174 start_codon:yes stop_codon:yes gene_type:complete